MRSLIFVLAISASGCYLSHERAMTDAAVPVADAFVPDAPLPADGGTDAGSDAGADAGPPDAGICDEPIVTVESAPIRCGDLLLGEDDRQVLLLDFNNRATRAVRIVHWPVGFDRGTATPADCAPRTISRVLLRTGDSSSAALVGEAALSSEPGGNYLADLRPDMLRIPPGRSSVSIRVDLTSYMDGGCTGWTTEIGFFGGDIEAVWDDDGSPVSAGCLCACIGGVLDYVHTGLISSYRAVLMTWPDITAWTRLAAGEQEIGRFRAANSMNEGNYTASLIDMAFGFSGKFGGDERPRTLRVYRDAVAPENLLASTTFPTGMVGTAFWADEFFTDLDVAAGTIRDIVVTLDADGVFPGSTLAVELFEARWTDGVSRSGRSICDGPATAGTTTFAPAP